jgi:hypothetical protein
VVDLPIRQLWLQPLLESSFVLLRKLHRYSTLTFGSSAGRKVAASSTSIEAVAAEKYSGSSANLARVGVVNPAFADPTYRN